MWPRLCCIVQPAESTLIKALEKASGGEPGSVQVYGVTVVQLNEVADKIADQQEKKKRAQKGRPNRPVCGGAALPSLGAQKRPHPDQREPIDAGARSASAATSGEAVASRQPMQQTMEQPATKKPKLKLPAVHVDELSSVPQAVPTASLPPPEPGAAKTLPQPSSPKVRAPTAALVRPGPPLASHSKITTY